MDPLQPPPTVAPPPPPPTTATTTTTITEAPINHMPSAANAAPTVPTPSTTTTTTTTTPAQSLSHPPYSEMICAAITALKERDGSSKRAIAKYIEKAYKGLPPTHSALLTHHLKRLKNNGLLVMVKKSYKLPRSDLPNHNNTTTNSSTTTGTTTTGTSSVQAHVTPSGPKRGRGRPPKPKTSSNGHQPSSQPVHPTQPISVPIPQPVLVSYATQPIATSNQPIETKTTSTTTQSIAQLDAAATAQPVLVALGLADDPNMGILKRPGRPKKVAAAGQGGLPVVGKKGRGRPPKTGGTVLGPKKSLGKPRKPKSVTAAGGVLLGANGMVKKRPGRPPKIQPNSLTVPYVAVAPNASSPTLVNIPKARGRPRKVAVSASGVVLMPAVKRPGRPPKVGAGGIAKPKKGAGRPVGRPKKNASASWTLAQASQPQAEAYGDLKRKLEFFQLRVRQAVGVLKPQFTSETAISAVAAIQELEGLASMDINTPLREEHQPSLLQS